MLGLGLVLGLFSALLGPAHFARHMFDRLQRRNNSHGQSDSILLLLLLHLRDLGVNMSTDLKVESQCNEACLKANRMLGLIKTTFVVKTPEVIYTFIFTTKVVQSQLQIKKYKSDRTRARGMYKNIKSYLTNTFKPT